MKKIVPRLLDPLDGCEQIGGCGATIRDFWSWAYSDLRSNTERGIFAEYLVALAVGDTNPVRKGFANHDVTTPSRTRVQVKATGRLQSWHQKRLSPPAFSRLSALSWDDVTGEFGLEPEVRADVFVFAFQTCSEPEMYDVLDLDQWEFRVVSASLVAAHPSKTIGMGFFKDHAPLRWHELADEIEATASKSNGNPS